MIHPQLGQRRGNLTEAVINELSARIAAGTYGAGDKLPSEQQLCREFGVSRTVLREAVASLRLGGRLVSRQGLGVFVADQSASRLDFQIAPAEDVRAALHTLELRLAVELEAVALAAERRSPAAIADLTRAYDRLLSLDGATIEEEAEADFEFHAAIARATNNPHFPRFLAALGPDIIFDLRLKHAQAPGEKPGKYAKKVNREHGAILSAISQGDPGAARTALRKHLEESLLRYRRLIDVNG